jgi:D-3-phosphoglycerate dehydrogenase
MSILRPYVALTEKMGSFQTQLIDSGIEEVHVNYEGRVSDYDLTPLTTAMLKGLLSPILGDDVNFINASIIASERGIKVTESKTKTSTNFVSLITLTVKSMDSETVVSGTIFGKNMPRMLRINDFYLEAIPAGHNLLIHNLDVPGMIGHIATTLGKHNINICNMAVGQEKPENQNVILLSTNIFVDNEIVEELCQLENIFSVRRIEL